jgi:hypothetical protein
LDQCVVRTFRCIVFNIDQEDAMKMTHILVAVIAAALVVAPAGFARANDAHHPGQSKTTDKPKKKLVKKKVTAKPSGQMTAMGGMMSKGSMMGGGGVMMQCPMMSGDSSTGFQSLRMQWHHSMMRWHHQMMHGQSRMHRGS